MVCLVDLGREVGFSSNSHFVGKTSGSSGKPNCFALELFTSFYVHIYELMRRTLIG